MPHNSWEKAFPVIDLPICHARPRYITTTHLRHPNQICPHTQSSYKQGGGQCFSPIEYTSYFQLHYHFFHFRSPAWLSSLIYWSDFLLAIILPDVIFSRKSHKISTSWSLCKENKGKRSWPFAQKWSMPLFQTSPLCNFPESWHFTQFVFTIFTKFE